MAGLTAHHSQDMKQHGQTKNDMNIGTLNVRTLSNDDHLENLLEELKLINCDVLGLCEVRRPGCEMINLDDWVFMYQGKTKEKSSGVGFLVKNTFKRKIVEFVSKSDRIARLTIRISEGKKLNLVQAYAPTSTDQEITRFYDDLRYII